MATNQKLPESSKAPPSRNLPCGWSWISVNSDTGPTPGGGGGSPQGWPCAGAGCAAGACATPPLPGPKIPASARDKTQAIDFLLIVTAVPSPCRAKAMFTKDFLALMRHVGAPPPGRIPGPALRVELMAGGGKCKAEQARSGRAGNIHRKVIGAPPLNGPEAHHGRDRRHYRPSDPRQPRHPD